MKHLLFAFIAASILSACSDIPADDRYIPIDSATPQRTILIEDFTGQNCVNCPAAHKKIEDLVKQYGDAIIPVSIHAGTFGIPATNTRYTGLMQPEGNTYNDAWDIKAWPQGVVNRAGGAKAPDEWGQTVRDAISMPTPLDIDIDASCADGTISIGTTLSSTVDLDAEFQIWVIEDGIVARQEDIDRGRIMDYVHNHVYRTAVNGVGGEHISLTAMIHRTASYSVTLKSTDTETWNPDNLSIVAFAYTTDGVVQAAKTKVINNQ